MVVPEARKSGGREAGSSPPRTPRSGVRPGACGAAILIAAQCSFIPGPPLCCVDGVLDVAVEVEAPGAALAAEAGQPGAAERRGQVADEETVDPDGAGDQPRRHPLRPGLVAGEH